MKNNFAFDWESFFINETSYIHKRDKKSKIYRCKAMVRAAIQGKATSKLLPYSTNTVA